MKKLLVLVGIAFCVGNNAIAGGDAEVGKRLVTEKGCVACHGPTGETTPSPDNPKLAGQHGDYLARALADYKTGKRKNPIMMGMAANLTTQEIEDLAAWFSSQKGLLVK